MTQCLNALQTEPPPFLSQEQERAMPFRYSNLYYLNYRQLLWQKKNALY